MMMAIGMFVFGMHTVAYQELQRKTEWRHASSSRVGENPARQFTGRGDDTLTLPGKLYPELCGSALSLDLLRQMANTGKAWPIIEGTGRVMGLWTIDSISETKTLFFSDGAARSIEFNLELTRVDDGLADMLGTVLSTAGNLLRAVL
jgi:phage protein U